MAAVTFCFPTVMQHETSEVVRRLRSRDPDFLDTLIETYQARLFRYILSITGHRQTAEDVFQETWVRVLERGHQYDGRWKFESWLFTIARNLVIDLSRQKKAASLDALQDPEQGVPFEPADTKGASPYDVLAGAEQSERVALAMGRLPAAYREVLVLRFQEEMQLDEIAKVIDERLSTVKSRLYRGLDALRAAVEGARP